MSEEPTKVHFIITLGNTREDGLHPLGVVVCEEDEVANLEHMKFIHDAHKSCCDLIDDKCQYGKPDICMKEHGVFVFRGVSTFLRSENGAVRKTYTKYMYGKPKDNTITGPISMEDDEDNFEITDIICSYCKQKGTWCLDTLKSILVCDKCENKSVRGCLRISEALARGQFCTVHNWRNMPGRIKAECTICKLRSFRDYKCYACEKNLVNCACNRCKECGYMRKINAKYDLECRCKQVCSVCLETLPRCMCKRCRGCMELSSKNCRCEQIGICDTCCRFGAMCICDVCRICKAPVHKGCNCYKGSKDIIPGKKSREEEGGGEEEQNIELELAKKQKKKIDEKKEEDPPNPPPSQKRKSDIIEIDESAFPVTESKKKKNKKKKQEKEKEIKKVLELEKKKCKGCGFFPEECGHCQKCYKEPCECKGESSKKGAKKDKKNVRKKRKILKMCGVCGEMEGSCNCPEPDFVEIEDEERSNKRSKNRQIGYFFDDKAGHSSESSDENEEGSEGDRWSDFIDEEIRYVDDSEPEDKINDEKDIVNDTTETSPKQSCDEKMEDDDIGGIPAGGLSEQENFDKEEEYDESWIKGVQEEGDEKNTQNDQKDSEEKEEDLDKLLEDEGCLP